MNAEDSGTSFYNLVHFHLEYILGHFSTEGHVFKAGFPKCLECSE